MQTDLHRHLVYLGAKWLKRQGFAVVATEINALGCREQADVVGFRATCSAMIEAKASRSDFLADLKKSERSNPSQGIGVYRFFLSPPGVISIEDLPQGWGLLHAQGTRIIETLRPQGNLWPPSGSQNWKEWQHPSNLASERAVLFSIARRNAQLQASPTKTIHQ